jgi:hypothetical protein
VLARNVQFDRQVGKTARMRDEAHPPPTFAMPSA